MLNLENCKIIHNLINGKFIQWRIDYGQLTIEEEIFLGKIISSNLSLASNVIASHKKLLCNFKKESIKNFLAIAEKCP